MDSLTDHTVSSSQNTTAENGHSYSQPLELQPMSSEPLQSQPMNSELLDSQPLDSQPTHLQSQHSLASSSFSQPSWEEASAASSVNPDYNASSAPAPVATTALTKAQSQWCSNTLKALKKNKSSGPFLEPVDPVKFNIPTYPDIVKKPMDLSTVQAKFSTHQYTTVDEFVSDVRLIFSNCYLFNGQDAPVSLMAAELEKVFDRAVYKMPPSVEPTVVSKGPCVRSETVPYANHKQPTLIAQPVAAAKTTSKKEVAGTMSADEKKRCRKALDELKKPQHNAIAWPFLLPVDPVAWNIVGYFDVVKHPMDISTVEHKLNAGEYKNAAEFEADVRLIFHNCYIFNTPDNEVYQMGQALEAVFNENWKIASSSKVASSSSKKNNKSAKEKRIEQLEEQLRRLKQQLNDQQEEVEEDDDDQEFKVIQKSSKRPRATSRRQYQSSDDDDDDDLEFVPKKRRMSKSFPGEKSVPIEKQEPSLPKPPVPSAPALSKSPLSAPQLNSLPGNRPKLALGATITALSPPPDKEQEKKPEIVLQNEDKWLALMRADATSRPSTQSAAPSGISTIGADTTTPSTSPSQDSGQKIDPLWQKFQEERRLREEQEREAREIVKRKEKERKEEEEKRKEQAEAAKRAKEDAEREKRRSYHRQHQEQAKSWTVDLYRQKRMMERFERESWADSEWREEMKRQQEAAESRRVIMPAFTLNTGLTLEQVKQAILHHRDSYKQRKLEHGDERIVDMEME